MQLGGFDWALRGPIRDGALPRGEASDYAAPEVRGSADPAGVRVRLRTTDAPPFGPFSTA